MKKLTGNQENLLWLVRSNQGKNTSGLRSIRGDSQAYDSALRNRLMRLAKRGLITYMECIVIGKWGNKFVCERRWRMADENT